MTDGPTLLQRQAIGNMFDFITKSHHAQWGDYLFEELKDWDIIPNSDISASCYYSTLHNLPDWPKRVIVQIILNGWNKHHDSLTLYDSINTLIALGVCGPSEYLLMQEVYNFLQYFKDVCDDDNKIILHEANINSYSLLFTKDGAKYGDRNAVVDISMSQIGQKPMVMVAPTYFSFASKFSLPIDYHRLNEQRKKELVIEKILPIVTDEFAKRHCPWIYSDYNISYKESRLHDAPLVILEDIDYTNRNY